MTSPVFECPECGLEWAEDQPQETNHCPNCHATTDADPIGEEVFLRGKTLYMQCEDLDDMIAATEARLEQLRQLREEGFEVSDPNGIRDDYCTLIRYVGD